MSDKPGGVPNVGQRHDDVSIKTYVDALVLPWVNRMREGDITLREHVEAIFDELRLATRTAADEREKTAAALRHELARAIEVGDRHLREHVAQQVEQIRAALLSADLLERSRIDQISERMNVISVSAEQHVEQLRRERQLVTGAQADAIAKAERATEERFHAVNEFRAQLTDTIQRFLPREVADAQFEELRKAIIAMGSRLDRGDGQSLGVQGARTQFTSQAQMWIGVLGLMVAVLSIAVVVILANAGQ